MTLMARLAEATASTSVALETHAETDRRAHRRNPRDGRARLRPAPAGSHRDLRALRAGNVGDALVDRAGSRRARHRCASEACSANSRISASASSNGWRPCREPPSRRCGRKASVTRTAVAEAHDRVGGEFETRHAALLARLTSSLEGSAGRRRSTRRTRRLGRRDPGRGVRSGRRASSTRASERSSRTPKPIIRKCSARFPTEPIPPSPASR